MGIRDTARGATGGKPVLEVVEAEGGGRPCLAGGCWLLQLLDLRAALHILGVRAGVAAAGTGRPAATAVDSPATMLHYDSDFDHITAADPQLVASWVVPRGQSTDHSPTSPPFPVSETCRGLTPSPSSRRVSELTPGRTPRTTPMYVRFVSPLGHAM
jgi:hypothetical protein